MVFQPFPFARFFSLSQI